eukprot:scaffold100671_cov24-Tisochrysis_lutea.AAC.2
MEQVHTCMEHTRMCTHIHTHALPGRGSRRGSAAHEGHEYGGSASQPEAAFPDIVIAPNAERRTHR